MSKKSSTFALEMKKKSYIQPITETLMITAWMPLTTATTKQPQPGQAPPVNAPVF